MGNSVIIVDWGTSSFRAWLIDEETGRVRDSIAEGRGMGALDTREFPAYFDECLGAWRARTIPPPVYMAGMVGAAQGWQEAPQPPLPVTIREVARQTVPVSGADDVWIVPGVRVAADPPDVMRGEEVQIFGALALSGGQDARFCLPGTHSKWAHVANGALVDFHTSMTGEVYAVMLGHSILGRGLEESAGENSAAFQLGLEQADRSGGLLLHLFTARTRVLFGGLPLTAVRSYLSGLLIGSEVRAMAELTPPDGKELLLISATALREPYQAALTRAGYRCHWIDSGAATLRGVREVIAHHRQQEGRAGTDV
ncbi:MAG: 2-dehydro-3-deoxygalactonokinase [Gammaproteobacteria bacterium]|nr:2-dehydro-3-deoxygalactonokinase [Gammaproteobacteria bacterium]